MPALSSLLCQRQVTAATFYDRPRSVLKSPEACLRIRLSYAALEPPAAAMVRSRRRSRAEKRACAIISAYRELRRFSHYSGDGHARDADQLHRVTTPRMIELAPPPLLPAGEDDAGFMIRMRLLPDIAIRAMMRFSASPFRRRDAATLKAVMVSMGGACAEWRWRDSDERAEAAASDCSSLRCRA